LADALRRGELSLARERSGLQAREETLSILIATSLILAQPFKFGFGFGCVLALALQINNQSLLLSEPSFSLDHLALDPPQFVK